MPTDPAYHRDMLVRRYDRFRDPIPIAGCVLWLPCDKKRDILPTGQIANADGAATQVFETYNGVPCLNQTGVSSGATRYFFDPKGRIGTASVRKSAGNGFSISLWVYGNTPAGHNLLQVTLNDDRPYYVTSTDQLLLQSIHDSSHGDNLAVTEYYGSTSSSSTRSRVLLSTFSTGWNHVVVTGSSGGVLHVYVNNVAAGSASSFKDSFAGWFVGRFAIPGRTATCRMAGVRMYSHVLTSTERKMLLNEYKPT